MKQLILLLVTFVSIATYAQTINCPLSFIGSNPAYVDTAGLLKTRFANHRCFAYAYGIDSLRDGRGGVYMYDTALTNAHDGLNYIQPGFGSSCPQVKGRWARANQSVIQYAQGKLIRISSGYKIFIGQATTTGTNTATLNLTEDNTAGGKALFTGSNIMASATVINSSLPAGNTVSMAGATFGGSNKTATFTFSYSSLATVLGINVLQIATLPSGTPFKFIVQGD